MEISVQGVKGAFNQFSITLPLQWGTCEKMVNPFRHRGFQTPHPKFVSQTIFQLILCPMLAFSANTVCSLCSYHVGDQSLHQVTVVDLSTDIVESKNFFNVGTGR